MIEEFVETILTEIAFRETNAIDRAWSIVLPQLLVHGESTLLQQVLDNRKYVLDFHDLLQIKDFLFTQTFHQVEDVLLRLS